MRIFKILKKPLITEKTSNLEIDQKTYAFIVSPDSTKIDIKKAILDLYWVEVLSVNIVNTREKFKYWKKRWMQIKRRMSKKAYITLKDKKAKLDFSNVK